MPRIRGFGRGRGWLGLVLALLLALLLVPVPAGATGGPASAQEQRLREPGDLRVYLLTFGPGAAVWERFGHNALWVHDPVAGSDQAYHYGLFDMSESGFLLHFLQGRMLYSMGEAPAPALIEYYQRYGRAATIQELRLTQDQARALQEFLEWNMLPENRVYHYHYFRDNCSTRIRDALDRVLDGRLREALERRPTDITYRSEALRLTGRDRLLTLGLDVVLGPLADRRLTDWELGFIPMRLRDAVRTLSIEHDGRARPIVIGEQAVPPTTEPDAEQSAPTGVVSARVVWMFLVGAVIGALMAIAGRMAAPRPPASATGAGHAARRGSTAARVGLATAGALWGAIAGTIGAILLALWLFTDHEFAHANENLLQANPLALALVALLPLALARGRNDGPDGRAAPVARLALGLAAGLLGLSALGLLLRPIPLTSQATLGIIALALPIHAGLFLGLRASLARPDASTHPPD